MISIDEHQFRPGEIHVLNAHAGGVTVDFDDAEEAAKLIRRLLKEGYTVVVRSEDGSTHRAVGADGRDGGAYLVRSTEGGPEPPRREVGTCPVCKEERRVRIDGRLFKHSCGSPFPLEAGATSQRKKAGLRRVHAPSSRGVAIAPSAGG